MEYRTKKEMQVIMPKSMTTRNKEGSDPTDQI